MPPSKKIIHTCLDDLPFGEAGPEAAKGPVGKVRLPDGISQRILTRDVVRIAWPSLLELVLTQLTSMADQVMVGRLPGTVGIAALSAVGLAAQPKFLLMTMIQAMNVGSTAMIARYRGQQNRDKANQTFLQAIYLNLFMSILFMTLGLVFCRQLIAFMASSAISEETLTAATTYLRIQMYGFVPFAMSFTITAALRGIGDPRTPMIYNTTANVVNVLFNYILIYGKFGAPAMGVAGASLATVIGQTTAFFMAFSVVLGSRHYIYLDFRKKFRFDGAIMRSVSKIGLPSMIEQLFMRAGMIIFSRTVAGLGDVYFATHQVCMNIQSMSFMVGNAFATATTTLMGQSLGKRRYDMAASYMKQTRRLGQIVSILLGVIFAVYGGRIVGFYNKTPEVIAAGGQVMLIIGLCQPIQTTQFITSGGLRGAGDTRFVAIVTSVTVLGVRTILAILTIRILNWGLWGAWAALIADQCLRTALVCVRYEQGHWKRIALKNRFDGA